MNKFLGRTGLGIDPSDRTLVVGDGASLTWRGEGPCGGGGAEQVFDVLTTDWLAKLAGVGEDTPRHAFLNRNDYSE